MKHLLDCDDSACSQTVPPPSFSLSILSPSFPSPLLLSPSLFPFLSSSLHSFLSSLPPLSPLHLVITNSQPLPHNNGQLSPLLSPRFYSVSSSLHRLLGLCSNKVMVKAKNIVGQDLLEAPEEVSTVILVTGPLGREASLPGPLCRLTLDTRPLEEIMTCLTCRCLVHGLLMYYTILYCTVQSLVNLKQALRVCAAFRGCYLDFRDKAEGIVKSQRETLQHGDTQEQYG